MRSFLSRVAFAYLASRIIVLAGVYFCFSFLTTGLPGENPKPHMRGVMEQESWRWLSGDAELSLPPPSRGAGERLRLRMYPVVPDLPVVVSVAGMPVDTLLVVEGLRDYTVDLPPAPPADVGTPGERLAVTLQSPSWSPYELTDGLKKDRRRLSVCLCEVGFGESGRTVPLRDGKVFPRGGYSLETAGSGRPDAAFFMGALFQWDAGWYRSIVQHGYMYSRDLAGEYQSPAFYPLYPLACRAFIAVTGMKVEEGMLLLANIFALIGVLVCALAVRAAFSESVAWAAALFLCFYPDSMFLSLAYSESLMIPLVGLFFWAIVRRRFWIAAVACGLATACRGSGLVLAPALLWAYFAALPAGARFRLPALSRGAALSAVGVSGLAFYALHLWLKFGEPLAFSASQKGWVAARTTGWSELLAGMPVWEKMSWVLQGRHLALLVDPRTMESWGLLVAVVLLALAWRRLPAPWKIAGLALPLLPYIFYAGTNIGLTSMGRYLAIDLPVFTAAAVLLDRPGLRPLVAPISAVMAIGLFAFTVFLAAGHYFVG